MRTIFWAGAMAVWGLASLVAAAPRHVYLTWQGSTSRTITVNYQTLGEGGTAQVLFDSESRGGDPAKYKFQAVGSTHQIPGLLDERWIHWVELLQLKPGATYYFVAGDEKNGFSPEQKFRTSPAGSEPIRFVEGGDMGTGPDVIPLLKHAAQHEPLFGMVGGDIAYTDTLDPKLWDAWLDLWEQNMITPRGYTIPMLLAIGNHEVRGGFGRKTENAPVFYGFFAQAGDRAHFSREFGENLVIILLDSGHTAPHGGEQAAWLKGELEKYAGRKYKFASYHVPLYPSYRRYEELPSANGRKNWMPLFDQYNLTTAFEHHDHSFKRTKLLRDGKEDPSGVLYLGDGCWGKGGRKVESQLRWYEEKAASIQHFWRVDVSDKGAEYRAYDKEGKLFDVYPTNADGAEEARKNYLAVIFPGAL